MDLIIREVRSDDAEGIIAILNPIIAAGQYTVLDAPFTVEAEREFIARFPERGVFHVAERVPNGRIVGFQSLEPYGAYTHAFHHVATVGTYVDLAEGRKGIGMRLAEATFEAARRKGFEKIFTYVRADNPNALAFYLKLGFRVVGTAQRQARFGEHYVNEVIIEKFL